MCVCVPPTRDTVTHNLAASPSPTASAASSPRPQRFGAHRVQVATGLSVRHDHGSTYLWDVFQNELRFLGVHSSPAFVREPEGNGCAERFIRTLKDNLLWVHSFTTVEDLRQALLAFKDLHDRTWLIERHGFKTPAQARQRLLEAAT